MSSECTGNNWTIHFRLAFYMCVYAFCRYLASILLRMNPQSQGSKLKRINWNHNTLFVYTIEIKFHWMKRLLSTSFAFGWIMRECRVHKLLNTSSNRMIYGSIYNVPNLLKHKCFLLINGQHMFTIWIKRTKISSKLIIFLLIRLSLPISFFSTVLCCFHDTYCGQLYFIRLFHWKI